jgi:hypothetical protein
LRFDLFNFRRRHMELLWFLLIGLMACWLASAIVGGGYELNSAITV